MNNANKFLFFNIKNKKTISQELFFAGSSYRTPINDITRLVNYINVLYKGETVFKHRLGVFAALFSSNYEIETQQKEFNGFIGQTSEYIFSKLLDQLVNQIIDIEYTMFYNLKLVIKNQDGFNNREKQFINHPWAHLYFLIL